MANPMSDEEWDKEMDLLSEYGKAEPIYVPRVRAIHTRDA